MHSRSIAPIASVSGVADHVIRAWDGTAPVVAMVMTHHSHAYIGLSEQSRYQLYNMCGVCGGGNKPVFVSLLYTDQAINKSGYWVWG